MKKSERDEVIKAEADAEKLYQAHIEQAKIHARNIAEDQARKDTERAAAEESERALSRIEEARLMAQQEPDVIVARKTFWERLFGN